MPDLVEAVVAARVPTVDLCNSVPDMQVPRVMTDDEAEGTIAAAHLLECGFTRFVFVGYSRSSGHRNAFTQAIHAAGGECSVVAIDDPAMQRETGKFLTSSQIVHDEGSALRRAWARRFFSKCDKPVARYIEHLRLKEAVRLLVNTDTAIGSIAAQCGFGKPLRFRLAFTRTMGIGPRAYRKKHRAAAARH